MSNPTTPNEVYSHWLSMNEALLLLTTDKNITSKISRLQANEYSDKMPSDVLNEVVAFKGKLDALRQKNDLGETPHENIPTTDQVTPADVLVYSEPLLNAMQELAIQINQDNKDCSFHSETVTGKQPSDVFGLVDLANRKIDLLL